MLATCEVEQGGGSADCPVLDVMAQGPTAAAVRRLNGLPVEVSAGCPAGTAYLVDGSRVVAVVRTAGGV